MSDKKPETNPNQPRKLGTLSTLLAQTQNETSYQRLNSLRSKPANIPRDFAPSIPVRRIPPKKEEQPTEAATPAPSAPKQFIPTAPRNRKVNFSVPNILSSTGGGGVFASGPPQQDKQKKSSIGTVLKEDIEFNSDGLGAMSIDRVVEIDPFDSNHPTIIPYSEEARIKYKQNVAREENSFGEYSDNLFIRSNEMCLFQLPSSLPIPLPEKPKTEKDVKVEKEKVVVDPDEATSFENEVKHISDLPEGKLGKLKVYKSGKVKLQIGGFLYDVMPGSECSFLQQIMVVSPDTKQCYQLGDLQKQFICIPDFEKLL